MSEKSRTTWREGVRHSFFVCAFCLFHHWLFCSFCAAQWIPCPLFLCCARAVLAAAAAAVLAEPELAVVAAGFVAVETAAVGFAVAVEIAGIVGIAVAAEIVAAVEIVELACSGHLKLMPSLLNSKTRW